MPDYGFGDRLTLHRLRFRGVFWSLRSLDDSYQKSKSFYILFIIQLIVATGVALFVPLSLFKVAVFTQTINAVALPPVFYYLIKLTNDRQLMGEFANNKFQKISRLRVPWLLSPLLYLLL